jgi:hypothetical protein
MQTEVLIEQLVGDLTPVRPRNRRLELLAIAGLLIVQAMLFLTISSPRADFGQAMATPAFWWKVASISTIAWLATAATLHSLDPAGTMQSLSRFMRRLGLAAIAVLALGWLVDVLLMPPVPLLDRLDWREGVDCLANIAFLTLPMALAFGLLVRRGASTRPEQTATMAGLAAAGLAALVFALHCPHDDPVYVTVWYGSAMLANAGLVRLVLARVARW